MLHDAVEALRQELNQLKLKLDSSLSSNDYALEEEPEVGSGKSNLNDWQCFKPRKRSRPKKSRPAVTPNTRVSEPSPSTQSTSLKTNSSKKVIVPGARRVWGTMRACTVPTVVKSIKRLTDVGDLRVKRKFKTGNDGKITRWWYVVHAEEAHLQQLENEWEKVKFQTSWKLEPCYRYLEGDIQIPLPEEQSPIHDAVTTRSESEVAPLDLAPAALSQCQEVKSQREES